MRLEAAIQGDLGRHMKAEIKAAGGAVVCQRRSKFRPLGRSKSGPLLLMPGEIYPVVPVVHRRDPRCFV